MSLQLLAPQTCFTAPGAIPNKMYIDLESHKNDLCFLAPILPTAFKAAIAFLFGSALCLFTI